MFAFRVVPFIAFVVGVVVVAMVGPKMFEYL